MRSSELIGRRATVKVHDTPCRVRHGDCAVLSETVTGTLRRFINMPGGPIGFIEVAGQLIAFDAGTDLASGKVEIELFPRLELVKSDKERSE